jgi:OPA family glycerol-3-phosphate transporter-like MFS transporter
MIPIVLQGMLRDGITTWMPSFIAESFHLGNEISILTGVLLPIFSIGCNQAAGWLYRKKISNPVTAAALLFCVGAIMALALYFCCNTSAAASVLMSATLTGCMHGVNLMLICMLPQCFERYGNISTVSGVLNACTYIGSALSTYGIAALSEVIGWQNTIFLWFCVAAADAAICLLCARPWQKKFMSAE